MSFDISKMTRGAAKVGDAIYKHRSDLLFIFGTVTRAVGTGLFVKKTFEIADKVRDYAPAKTDILRDEMLTDEEKEFEVSVLTKDLAKTVVKAYSIPAAVSIVGTAMEVGSHVSMKNDLNKLSAALGATTIAYETLKSGILDRADKEVYNEIVLGDPEEIVSSNGEVLLDYMNNDIPEGFFAYKFNIDTSTEYDGHPDMDRLFLVGMKDSFQKKLEVMGKVSLSYALKKLGYSKKVYSDPAIATAGWTYGQRIEFGDIDSGILEFNCLRNIYI